MYLYPAASTLFPTDSGALSPGVKRPGLVGERSVHSNVHSNAHGKLILDLCDVLHESTCRVNLA
jgi:hypothetical protein